MNTVGEYAMPFDQTDWERYAECYDALNHLEPYRAMLATVADLVNDESNMMPILEAGCGTGNLTRLIEKRDEIVAVDFSQQMLTRARGKCPGVKFHWVDLSQSLAYRDGTFGCVVSTNVLYALPNPEESIREFARVLRSGGRLILVTPKEGYENGLILRDHCASEKPMEYWLNAHASPEREEMLLCEALADSRVIEELLHVSRINSVIARTTTFTFFNELELRELAIAAGLTVERVSYVYAEQNMLLVARKSC